MDPITESYLEIKPLIQRIASRFHRSYGGELQDWISEGNLAFVRACRGFDPRKGTFGKRIRAITAQALIAQMHRRIKKRLPGSHQADPEQIPSRRQFDLESFVLELSEEASEMVRTCVARWKDARVTLLSKGWSGVEIERVSEEIQEALR